MNQHGGAPKLRVIEGGESPRTNERELASLATSLQTMFEPLVRRVIEDPRGVDAAVREDPAYFEHWLAVIFDTYTRLRHAQEKATRHLSRYYALRERFERDGTLARAKAFEAGAEGLTGTARKDAEEALLALERATGVGELRHTPDPEGYRSALHASRLALEDLRGNLFDAYTELRATTPPHEWEASMTRARLEGLYGALGGFATLLRYGHFS